jgi:hypothetical protein
MMLLTDGIEKPDLEIREIDPRTPSKGWPNAEYH